MSEQQVVQKTRVIVLDVGNVMVGLDFSRSQRRLEALISEPEVYVRMRRWLGKVEDHYALGELTTEEFLQEAQREFALDRERFIDIWSDIFVEREYMLPFMRELRAQGYTLAICSNTNELHMDYLQRVSPCFAEAQQIIFSYRVHALKPDPVIYHAVETATGYLAAEHLFLDDLPENVTAARRLGWDAICFETPEQAQAELVARGIEFTPWKL